LTSSDSDSTVLDLRRRLEKDHKQGGLRHLSEYLSKFPGSEAIVATEWLAATQDEAELGHDHANSEFADGRYELKAEIGRGGQGSVFVAHDHKLDRDVAVKVLSRTGPITPNAVNRFRREALLASKLDHPGICAVYDAGEEAGVLYLVMRLISGQTLAKVIANSHAVTTGSGNTSLYFDLTGGVQDEEKTTPEVTEEEPLMKVVDASAIDRLLELIEKAARALHYAHETGVIHRDIKPANIMVTDDLEPVILDFGLARDETDETAELSIAGEVFGTPAYMSPEQLEEGMKVDQRTDVYSLGATLYETIATKRLFSAPTRRALFDNILRVQPRRLSSVVQGISRDLEIVVHTAIEKDRDQRYQSALDLADEIGRVRRNEPILASPPSLIMRLRLWYRRDRSTALAAMAAALILIVGTISSLALAGMAEKERGRADAENVEYRRLADSRKLKQLRSEAEEQLWPTRATKSELMRNWLSRADQLFARLPEHRLALETLRTNGRLETKSEEADRFSELDQRRQRIRQELTEVEQLLNAEERPAGWGTIKEQVMVERRVELNDGLKELKTAKIKQSWIFASADLGWRHDRLAELVDGLDALDAAGSFDISGYASVAARLNIAESLRQDSVEKQRAAWDTTIREIEEAAIYKGLKITPQVGLLPLGFNPQGLAEFAQLISGNAPARGPEGELFVTEESAMILILVPGGEFVMGAPPDEFGRQKNEIQHTVNLAPFFIGKHEVNQAQWTRIMGKNAAHYRPGDNPQGKVGDQVINLLHPIESINWHQASDFVLRANLLLPTEARWEFACRAGSIEAFTWGADPFSVKGRGNVGDQALAVLGQDYRNLGLVPWNDGWTVHSQVNAGACNAFGLYGLHGNVSEWCLDRYSDSYPVGVELPPNGENTTAWFSSRNFRDGNFINGVSSARTAIRWRCGPHHRNVNIGVRVARDLD
jgi:serine/threonine protein kinase/formylglycine-generating enzyme required for sulfatase activity